MPLPDRVCQRVHRQAAFAVASMLAADSTKRGGASVKALTLAPSIVAKKATFALTCETLRYLPVLKELLATTDVLTKKNKISEALAYVLTYDLLFGQGLQATGPAQLVVLGRKGALKAALARLMIKRQVATPADLLPPEARSSEPSVPRYVRVNTLKLSVEAARKYLEGPPIACTVELDALVPELLVLPPGTDLHADPHVLSGALVLQGRSSCLPVVALAPEPTWQVIDACAAPGNKTSQLAAAMQNQGHIIACEKDPARLARLQATLVQCGATNVVARLQDFLKLDPKSPECSQVQGVLLDPSCSGSGTVKQRLDHLMPSAASRAPAGKAGEVQDEHEQRRVEQLARFQEAALAHALSFPSVQRVAYSTCSVYRRENEDVIAALLPQARARGFDLAPALPQWPHRGLPVCEGAHNLLRMDAVRDNSDGFFVALFCRHPRQAQGSSSDLPSDGKCTPDVGVVSTCEGGASNATGRSNKRRMMLLYGMQATEELPGQQTASVNKRRQPSLFSGKGDGACGNSGQHMSQDPVAKSLLSLNEDAHANEKRNIASGSLGASLSVSKAKESQLRRRRLKRQRKKASLVLAS